VGYPTSPDAEPDKTRPWEKRKKRPGRGIQIPLDENRQALDLVNGRSGSDKKGGEGEPPECWSWEAPCQHKKTLTECKALENVYE
jgi:hypothetical protein